MAIINQHDLIEHLEGDLELLRDVFELFTDEKQEMQTELEAAIDAEDVATVCEVAHSMKGMLSNFLAESACQTAARIQELAAERTLEGVPELSQHLNDQMEAVELELKQILNSEGPSN
jgi:HPt (histidine-containing phosphotransfer) domain-containing protein